MSLLIHPLPLLLSITQFNLQPRAAIQSDLFVEGPVRVQSMQPGPAWKHLLKPAAATDIYKLASPSRQIAIRLYSRMIVLLAGPVWLLYLLQLEQCTLFHTNAHATCLACPGSTGKGTGYTYVPAHARGFIVKRARSIYLAICQAANLELNSLKSSCSADGLPTTASTPGSQT